MRAVSLCLAVVVGAGCSAVETDRGVVGDWAGWIYLDEGSDLPVRLGIVAGEDGLRATLDIPAQKLNDLEVQDVSWAAPTLRAQRTSDSGTVIAFDGRVEGDTVSGRVSIGDGGGEFWLHRSPEPLPDIDPDSHADAQGTYTDATGSIVVGSRFWGELLFTDLRTGRHGTLFPQGADRFFAGAALYVPGPIHARARFVRDEAGAVTGMEWQAEGGDLRTLRRRGFREEEFRFVRDGVELAGTLIVPDTPGPHPAIVILGGSNWAERGSVRRDASIFASFGMATLIYDKRGYGESGGEATVPFATTARDAVAAVRELKRRPDIRNDAVGLTGRSRGGWFAPLAAAEAPEVIDFLVLFVAPAVSPAEQESTRRLNRMRADGLDPGQIELAESYLKQAWRFGRTGRGFDSYRVAREEAAAGGVPDYVFETDSPDPAVWSWVRLNMHHDPIPYLERVRCPTLALFGGADDNVVPEFNLPPMREAFERAGNEAVELVVIPDADHGLRATAPGEDELPFHRKTGFGPAGWSTVGDWLERTVAPR